MYSNSVLLWLGQGFKRLLDDTQDAQRVGLAYLRFKFGLLLRRQVAFCLVIGHPDGDIKLWGVKRLFHLSGNAVA